MPGPRQKDASRVVDSGDALNAMRLSNGAAQSSIGSSDAPAANAGYTMMKAGASANLSSGLAALYYMDIAEPSRSLASGPGTSRIKGSLSPDGKYVLIDATANDRNGAGLLKNLEAIGLKGGGSYDRMASGWLPVTSVAELSAITNLGFARESAFVTNAGPTQAQADIAQHADVARKLYGVDGSGVRVGVLSDSFNFDHKMKSQQASGDLPADIRILSDASFFDLFTATDEGRGMAQIVHDLAPGAAIDFMRGLDGEANFANAILTLAAAGDKVIVDDVFNPREPAFQFGVAAEAIRKATEQYGVSYFSSAGNKGDFGYDGYWKAGADGSFRAGDFSETFKESMQFAPGQDYLNVTFARDSSIVLQWDQPTTGTGTNPGGGSATDLDIYLTDQKGTVLYVDPNPELDDLIGVTNNINHDPFEIITLPPELDGTYQVHVVLAHGPAPKEIRLIGTPIPGLPGERLPEPKAHFQDVASNINSGTMFGHAAAPDAMAVGAAGFLQTPAYNPNLTTAKLEYFSSGGGQPILYDYNGNRLAQPLKAGVAFVATDGSNISPSLYSSFFSDDIGEDADTKPNFYGTSASAPVAAAAAALLLSADPKLTPSDVRALLSDSALDMDDPATKGFDIGTDLRTGTGFIQADVALGFAKTHVIANAGQTALSGTHLDDTIFGGAKGAVINADEGNDVVKAGDGDDRVYGGGGADIVYGNRGNDNLFGDDGNDVMYGGYGNDALSGGDGDDVLAGGFGDDAMNGGLGSNTASYADALAPNGTPLVVDLGGDTLGFIGASGVGGKDSFLSIENVIGSAYRDDITGDRQSNILAGGGGADTLTGGGAFDDPGDVFKYSKPTDSTTRERDTITDFRVRADKIDLRDVRTGAADRYKFSYDNTLHQAVISVYLGGHTAPDMMIGLDAVDDADLTSRNILWDSAAVASLSSTSTQAAVMPAPSFSAMRSEWAMADAIAMPSAGSSLHGSLPTFLA